MNKHTRKNRKVKEYDMTYACIELWYKDKFENLGWTILAKRHGYTDKVMEYKNSILRLRDTIDRKIRKVHDKDKKTDLIIMKNNVEVLIEHTNKDLHL